MSEENSPLPILDSTRLLAKYAVQVASGEQGIPRGGGWLNPKAAPRRKSGHR